MNLSIVIVSWNAASLLVDCLGSLPAGAEGLDYETLVVDNASTDDSADRVTHNLNVRLIRSVTNLGFAGGNNLGIQAVRGDYLLLLNNDTLVKPGSLTALVHFMNDHPGAAVVGPRLLCLDGTSQPYAFGGDPTIGYLLCRGLSSLLFHRSLHDWTTDQVQQVDWVSGACMLIRRAALDQVGLLDENMFMYFEDNDLCLRIRQAGWQIYYNPKAEIIHLGGQSLVKNPRAQKAYYESLRYFYAKHYSRLSRLLLNLLLIPYQFITGQRTIHDAHRTS